MLDNKIPEHIKKGIELSKKLTENQVFNRIRERYRTYVVEYGETIGEINSGCMGGTFGEFEGGFGTGKGKVTVDLADKRTFVFSLKKIFDSLLKEKDNSNLKLFS